MLKGFDFELERNGPGLGFVDGALPGMQTLALLSTHHNKIQTNCYRSITNQATYSKK